LMCFSRSVCRQSCWATSRLCSAGAPSHIRPKHTIHPGLPARACGF